MLEKKCASILVISLATGKDNSRDISSFDMFDWEKIIFHLKTVAHSLRSELVADAIRTDVLIYTSKSFTRLYLII
jgi:hypothetical protein